MASTQVIATATVPVCGPPPRVTPISFNGTISLGEIAIIVTEIAIAVILQRYLARRSEARKAEKGILADQIGEVFTAIRDCQLKFQGIVGRKPTIEEKDLIIAATERIGLTLISLETAFGFSHCKDLQSECGQLTPLFLQYKGALTGNSFPHRKLSYSQQYESNQLQLRISKELHSLLFRVQKHR